MTTRLCARNTFDSARAWSNGKGQTRKPNKLERIRDVSGRLTLNEKSEPTTYIYRLANGSPFLRVSRTATKGFWQEQWTGSTWAKGAPKGPKVPYRLPELITAATATVLIVEGEKDADNLTALGYIATTNSGGASKWTPDLNRHFEGRDICILPDNDEPGARHAQQVAASLEGIARSICIVRLPGLPQKGDVSDWLDAGGSAEKLDIILRNTAEVENPPAQRLIASSSEFLNGFIPPDYLIDGLMQRRFCYSLTAATGTGKTAVALLLAAHVALGRSIGKHQLERGRVLYLAGENPDDVRMRWIAMSEKMGFDPAKIDVHFLPGVFKLSEIYARIANEVERIGGVVLVVVDTSAAYFEGADENGNVEMGNHARRMRSLVNLPGQPCALVACHPVKNPDPNSMLPRGGGAFLAEVDGNFTLSKRKGFVDLRWQGKFRGSDFEPLSFKLAPARADALNDSKGRPIPTVVATHISERARSEADADGRTDDDALLLAISEHDRASQAGLAIALGWVSPITGKPNKAKVNRCAKSLRGRKYLSGEQGPLLLTDKGHNEVKRLKLNRGLVGDRSD